MILQCPQCQSRFMVADALIPSDGRMVRCGKCKHDWHVMHSAVPMEMVESAQDTSVAPQESLSDVFAGFNVAFDEAKKPDDSHDAEVSADNTAMQMQLPAIKAKAFQVRPFIFSTAALAVLVLIIAPISYYPSFKTTPGFSAIYAMLGWKNTEGLILSDINMTKEKHEGMTKFIIAGNLMNQSEKTAVVPVVRIAMTDDKNAVVWSRAYQVNKTLKAGDIYPFRITNAQTVHGNKVAQILVDVGNDFELMVR